MSLEALDKEKQESIVQAERRFPKQKQHSRKVDPFSIAPDLLSLNGSSKASFRSLESVQSSQSFIVIAVLLAISLVAFISLIIVVPWQQSVTGLGKIIIFSPMERPQNIEATIPGRLKSWKVTDGQVVKKGQLIAELSEIDSKFLDPEQIKKLQGQKQATEARRDAAKSRHRALSEQLSNIKRSQSAAVPSAKERSIQAKDRIWAAEQALQAAKQNLDTTQLNLKRIKDLHESGLRSRRDLELAQLDQTKAITDLQRADAALDIARRDQTLAILDQDKVLADTDAAISNLLAIMASVQETIESASSEIYKLDIELQNLKQRAEQRRITAPCDGRIVRLQRVGAGETVDAGAILAVLAPDTNDLAAELVVSDNDAPLIGVGRPVRLQFAGWPAIQFTGWPSIAVGTFAGKVAVVDAVDDGRSNYRVIVKPDKEAIASGRDEPWPDVHFLRPGAEASGWIMLDTVPLGFELWRQFNAFPPTVKPEELGLHGKGAYKSADIGKSDTKRKSK